ncbi:MAG: PQQ-dependent sugar dehydrogenase [Burkholderiaceae bacterium]|jgi:glucose/arabinose dehydrogenase
MTLSLKLACLGGLLAAVLSRTALAALPILEVPPGFHVSLLTQEVPNAREMALGGVTDGKQIVYVGSYDAGRVYAVETEAGKATGVHVIANHLEMPIGVAYRDGNLYVSAVSRILRLDGIDNRLNAPPIPAIVTDHLPSEEHHGGRFIAFGPDGWLYVPVGAPCNVCEPDPRRYANLERMRPDGTGLEVVAQGIRNTVGFDWSPIDGSLWFTDNGRDMMGDDMPSDELNHAPQKGMNFGFPYCHQGDTPDPGLGSKHPCSDFTPPAVKLGAHVAALGMRFYTGSLFPSPYRNAIFIAEHGSWNRSKKSGYRIAWIQMRADGSVEKSGVFATGWLKVDPDGHERVFGRPADVLVMPDGALLVSDDEAGAIYRITYGL